MKKYVLFILSILIFGCGSKNKENTFRIENVISYPVGKHTLRYSYNNSYLSLITRKVYKKKIDGYNFSHVLNIVKLPDFDTVFTFKKINLEWFELWKIKADTIMGFMGDGVPDKGPIWEYFKNIRFVKIVPKKGIVYDSVIFVARGKMGGVQRMMIVGNSSNQYLMFHYDFQLHLIELPSLEYLGHTKKRTLFLSPIYLVKDKMFISIVGSQLPGHSNDLYLGVVDIKEMKVTKMIPVFEDSIRNVYGVVGFSNKDNFMFTAGDGMFAHHIYAFYKGKYKLVFSFTENTIPFLSGGCIDGCNIFVVNLGHLSSFHSYRTMIGQIDKDSLLALQEVSLPPNVDFIYPPSLYPINKNRAALIISVFNREWSSDTLYFIKLSCINQ